MKQAISTTSAPAALGPYSQAVKCGKTFYVSGQLGLDPATGEFVSSEVEAQATQVLKNITAILAANNMTAKNVVKTTVLLASMDDFATVNSVYAKTFPPKTEGDESSAPPARACFAVKTLPKNAKVEIEAVAMEF